MAENKYTLVIHDTKRQWGSVSDDGIGIPINDYWIYSPYPEYQYIASAHNQIVGQKIVDALNASLNVAAREEAIRKEGKPKVICLCGSTRFTAEMLAIHWTFAKEGIICLGWEVYPTEEPADHLAEKQGIAEQFDELHKRKIDISDEVFVLNVGGYIGKSTRSEIDYAIAHNKPVKYLEGAWGVQKEGEGTK